MRQTFRDCVVLSSFALLADGCSAATQQVYVAPTSETIISDTEERRGEPPVHTIFVQNRSTVPVTVFSVSLNGCENVKQSCGPKPVRLHVAAGGRTVVMRVEPDNPERGFSYRFGFSWHADSSSAAALAALAASGDPIARERLAATQRADSIRRADVGRPRYNELSRDDFRALAARVTSMRADPESLVITPGAESSLLRIRMLLVDREGQVLGQTRWVRWQVPGQGALLFLPPDKLVARRPGRATLRFSLAEEAQQILTTTIDDVMVPVVAAYPFDPHAPTFVGRAVDADSKTPLACARIALEDSAQNVVTNGLTDATGAFVLRAPRPGTYRVRVDTRGWAPVHGPRTLANADEEKQHEYLVRFTEQLLVSRYDMGSSDFQHARPVAVRTEPISTQPSASAARRATASTPIVQGVTLGGSESMPILGIISRVPPATIWIQFVVDSTGRVDTRSILLPSGTASNVKASVVSVLPRVRFSPAIDAGKPMCEMLRMQVNFTGR